MVRILKEGLISFIKSKVKERREKFYEGWNEVKVDVDAIYEDFNEFKNEIQQDDAEFADYMEQTYGLEFEKDYGSLSNNLEETMLFNPDSYNQEGIEEFIEDFGIF